MNKITSASNLYHTESELVELIAKSRNISNLDALRLFLSSETHKMLLDDELKMWYFAPLALFDIWENEVRTGDPRNSFYLRGDEIV